MLDKMLNGNRKRLATLYKRVILKMSERGNFVQSRSKYQHPGK